jgi:tetratricopeptide (TPR) repeat protein
MTKNRQKSNFDLRYLVSIGKRLLTILSLLLLSTGKSPAQQVKSDSLFIFIEQQSSDSLKAEMMLKIAQEKYYSNSAEALEFGKKSNTIFKKLNNIRGIGRSSNLIGACYFSQGNYQNAKECFQQAIEYSTKANDSVYIVRCLNNLGNVYIKNGVFDQAVECLIKAKHLYIVSGNTVGALVVNNNIGELYRSIGNFRKALDYYTESLTLAESVGNEQELSSIYHNIGAVYTELEDYDKALFATEKSFELRSKINFKSGMIKNFISFGNIYQQKGERAKALSYYKKGLSLANELDLKDDEASILLHLGYIQLKDTKIDSARIYFVKSLTLAKELENSETTVELYQYLYYVDSLKGDYKSAIQNYAEYHSLKDKIDKFDPGKKIQELERKYALAQNEIDIQSAEIERKQKALIFLSLGIVFLILVAVLGIQTIRLRSKKRTLELMQENLRSQMNPHFIFNVLNSINAYILQNNKEASSKYLLKFARLLRLVLENAQNNLVSINDEMESLRLYLELEAMRLNNKIEYEIFIDDEIDPQMFKIPALILQPYVENSILHGLQNKNGGGKIAIKLEYANNSIHCSVSDNGIGRKKSMEKNQPSETNHKSYGTKITETRLKLLNSFYGRKLGIKYSDLNETNPELTGTIVEFDLPVMN